MVYKKLEEYQKATEKMIWLLQNKVLVLNFSKYNSQIGNHVYITNGLKYDPKPN